MQLYKTISTTTDNELTRKVSWQASQTEASKARSAAKKDGLKAETQTVNVPTAKGPLIDWLNENVAA
jgi:hypothetical protein